MDTNQLAQLVSDPATSVPSDPLTLAGILGYGAPPTPPPPEPVPGLAPQYVPDLSSLGVEPTTHVPAQAPTFQPDLTSLGVTPGPVASPGAESTPMAAPVAAPAKHQISDPFNMPEGQRLSAGTGFSAQGYSPGAMAAIQAGPGKQVRGEIDADQRAVQAEYAPLVAQQAEATANSQAAAAGVANSESKKILAEGEANRKIGAAQQDYAAKEQAILAQTQTEAAQAKAQYRAALTDFASTTINPSQLWDEGGAKGQFSMMATAFMHDFLGARGIQTSGMDSIRQAIQNNINAQIQNLNTKRETASGFKTLWDMQRQQSASDQEARDRMFGFYLTGLTNEVKGKLSLYDSDLAKAKGASAIAALGQEQVKSDISVQQHIDLAANARGKNRVELIGHELAAASARYAADAHVMAARIAAGNKQVQSPLNGLLADRNGTAYRRFLPDVEKATQDKLRQQSQAVGHTVSNIEQIIDLQNQIDAVPPGDIAIVNRLQNEKARAAEQLRNITKMAIIYDNSGKQINEQEIKLYDQIVGKKDWFLNGNNVRTLGILGKNMLDKNDSVLGGISVELTPEDPAYGFSFGKKQFDPATSTLTGIQSMPGSGEHVNSQAEKLVKEAQSPDAMKPENDSNATANWKALVGDTQFQSTLPPLAREALRHAELNQQGKVDVKGGDSLTGGIAITKPGETANHAFVALDHLADLALGGDQDARTQLKDLTQSSSRTTGAPNQDLLQALAIWEENRVHTSLAREGQEQYTTEEAAALHDPRSVPPVTPQ